MTAKASRQKLIPSELAGDVRGLGFIGPEGFFIVANNALWETDFKTGGYKGATRRDLFAIPAGDESGAGRQRTGGGGHGEGGGLALVPVKNKAVVPGPWRDAHVGGRLDEQHVPHATDTLDAQGKTHYQLRAVTKRARRTRRSAPGGRAGVSPQRRGAVARADPSGEGPPLGHGRPQRPAAAVGGGAGGR